MTRETKSERIMIRLEPSLKDRAERIAGKDVRTVSNLAYLALKDYVERREKLINQ